MQMYDISSSKGTKINYPSILDFGMRVLNYKTLTEKV